MKYVGLYDNNKDIVTKDKLDAVEAAIPTKVSELTNDANYITAVQAPVQSVNNKTGAVSLTASDVGALPVDTVIPTVNNAILTIKRNSVDVGSFTANAANDVNIDINVPTDKSDIGLGNVDNIKQYSATNPPPYPVTSVNGKTGDVTLSASDVGAQPTITVKGIIKGDGSGGVSAAKAGTDYAPPVMFVEVTGSSGNYETEVDTWPIWMIGRGKRSVFMYGDEDSMFYPLIASTQTQACFGGLDAYGNAVRYIVNSDRTVEKHLTPIGGKTYSVILTVAGWNASTKQQTVSFAAASSTETDHLLIPTPKLSDLMAYNNAGILCIGEDGTAQTLTFQCETVPTEDITIYVTIQSVNYQEVSV